MTAVEVDVDADQTITPRTHWRTTQVDQESPVMTMMMKTIVIDVGAVIIGVVMVVVMGVATHVVAVSQTTTPMMPTSPRTTHETPWILLRMDWSP